jgi:tetratricopeptide (TPR) repeat protein
LALLHREIAKKRWHTFRDRRALREHLEKYLATVEKLAADLPGDSTKRELATANEWLADYSRQLGDREAALEHGKNAVTLYTELDTAQPADRAAKQNLADGYYWAAEVHLTYGRLKQAREYYASYRAMCEELVKGPPDDSSSKRKLATVYANLGRVSLQIGDVTDAKHFYGEALKLRQELVGAEAQSIGARRDLAQAQRVLGDARWQWGDVPGALASYAACGNELTKLAKTEAGSLRVWRDAAEVVVANGVLLARGGDLERAKEWFRDAVRFGHELTVAEPQGREYLQGLAQIHGIIGDALGDTDEAVLAMGHYGEALALLEKSAASDSGNLLPVREIALLHEKVGRLHLRDGKYEEAAKALGLGLEAFQKMEQADSLTPDDRAAVRKLQRARNACGSAERAMKDLAFAATKPRAEATELLILRASSLAFKDRHEKAIETIERLRQLAPKDGQHLYDVARCYALCARATARGRPSILLQDGQKVAWTRYANGSVEALKSAVAHGYRDLAQLLWDDTFDPLRPIPGYAEVIRQIESKGLDP